VFILRRLIETRLVPGMTLCSVVGGYVCCSSRTRCQRTHPCCQLRLSKSLRRLRAQMWVGEVEWSTGCRVN